MATRDVRIIPKKTVIAGRVPTGTTGNEQNFIQHGELALNTTDHKLFSFDGTNVFEIGSSFTGGTIGGNFSAPNITATTAFYSGATELGSLITSIVTGSTLQGDYLPLSGGTLTGDLNLAKLNILNNSGSYVTAFEKGGSTSDEHLQIAIGFNSLNIQTNAIFNGNALPSGTRDLGSTTQKWNSAYISNIYNPIITTSSASSSPLIVKGFASQVSDLLSIQNSSSVNLFKIDVLGHVTGNNFSGTNVTLSSLSSSTATARMVEVNNNGTASAYERLMPVEVLHPDEIDKLTSLSGWTSGNTYTGASFDNNFIEQDQFYYDSPSGWYYRFIDNQTPVRWNVTASELTGSISGGSALENLIIILEQKGIIINNTTP